MAKSHAQFPKKTFASDFNPFADSDDDKNLLEPFAYSSNWSLATLSLSFPDSSERSFEGNDEGEWNMPYDFAGEVELLPLPPAIFDTLELDSKSDCNASSLEEEPIQITATKDLKIVPSFLTSPPCPSSPKIHRTVCERTNLAQLGFRYRYGCHSFPQDMKISSTFYSQAVALECSDSMAAMAISHIFNIGIEGNYEEARKLLRNAVGKGSLDAVEIRALCYMNGTFEKGNRDYASCIELLCMGVSRNSAACTLWAGFCFEVGLGVMPDAQLAKHAYMEAVASNTLEIATSLWLPGALHIEDPWTLLKIALFLLHSNNEETRRGQAMKCLKQAALLGLADAKVYLAMCLIHGKWIAQDSSIAIFWLQQAVEGDNPHPVAQRILRQLD